MFTSPFGFFSASSNSIIQSIQAFSITVLTSQNNRTATINSVDTSKSIIIHNSFSAGSGSDSTFNTGTWNKLTLTNSTTVTCTTDSNASSDMVVKGYVVEFKSNVVQSIQAGDILINASGSGKTSGTATISSVSVVNSMVVSAGGTSAFINNASIAEALTTLTLTDASTVTATRGSNGGGSYTASSRYQVLEFVPGIINSRNQVSNNIYDGGGGSNSTTISSVDLNKTILFNAGNRSGSNDVSKVPASLVTNSTTITGIVGINPDPESVANAQVMEFIQGVSAVQSGTITIPTSSTTSTATITSVDTTKSVVIYSGVTASQSTGQSSTLYANVVLTNSTTVTATRGVSSASQSPKIYFMVVTFV